MLNGTGCSAFFSPFRSVFFLHLMESIRAMLFTTDMDGFAAKRWCCEPLKSVSHTKFHWLSTASLPCYRIVAFASEQSFTMPLLLAIAPWPSTSLGVVGARWPWMRRKHRMLNSLANCVRERTEWAKNGRVTGTVISLERTGTEVAC